MLLVSSDFSFAPEGASPGQGIIASSRQNTKRLRRMQQSQPSRKAPFIGIHSVSRRTNRRLTLLRHSAAQSPQLPTMTRYALDRVRVGLQMPAARADHRTHEWCANRRDDLAVCKDRGHRPLDARKHRILPKIVGGHSLDRHVGTTVPLAHTGEGVANLRRARECAS